MERAKHGVNKFKPVRIPHKAIPIGTNPRSGNGRYTDDMPRIVYNFALLGLTDKRIADALGITINIFTDWRKRHLEFDQAVYDGRMTVDSHVAHTLLQQCVGWVEEQEFTNVSYKGTVTRTVRKVYHKPDGYLCLQWLSLRQRELWANSQKIDVTNTVTIKKVDLSDFTNDELKALEKVGVKQLIANAASKN